MSLMENSRSKNKTSGGRGGGGGGGGTPHKRSKTRPAHEISRLLFAAETGRRKDKLFRKKRDTKNLILAVKVQNRKGSLSRAALQDWGGEM